MEKIISNSNNSNNRFMLSRPYDNIPYNGKIFIYSENDNKCIPHFHVMINENLSDDTIELEIKFSNIRDMEILHSSNNSKSWDGIEDVRDSIIEWLDEVSVRNYGLTNLEHMIMSWNDCNPENEIGKKFTDRFYIDYYIDVSGCLCNFFKRYIDNDKFFLYGKVGLKDRFIINDIDIYNKILLDIDRDNFYNFLDDANKIDDVVKRSIYIIENIYIRNEDNSLNELAPKWYEAFLESMNVLRNVDSNCVIGVGGGYQTILDYISYGEYLLEDVDVLELKYGDYGIS